MTQTIFVTGATGFIGSHVVWKLRERGDTVRCLVRRPSKAGLLREIGATIIAGDINNRVSMREAMRGCDLVYHIAAWHELGISDKKVPLMEQTNVSGTENVLSMAYNLGIPKIVYTSSVAIFGNTNGQWVDETDLDGKPSSFESAYARTKWQAHFEVAQPLIEEGAPIVIVMPGAVYGPDDPGLIGRLIERFVKRRLPVLIGGEASHTWAYVDDVAEGHLLAADKGQPSESYILAGPALTIREALQVLAGLTRIPAPRFIGGSMTQQVAKSTVSGLNKLLPVPTLLGAEALKNLGEGTQLVKSEKAQQELGWLPRPLEEGFQTTVDWYRNQ